MDEQDICISVKDVSKKFSRSLKRSFVYGARDLVRTSLGQPLSTSLRASEFWALQDISFDLVRGQALGLVGLNGSGKTTLLRVVCGILAPTMGEVQVRGRIAPLLALGAGFQPALAGRENIFLNMSLLGLDQQTIARKFDDVVDFAGISESIDAPVGTYSTGMRARLAFSCAVHTDPSILVVDEILAVGDAQFRAQCRNKINELRKAGTSMLLVSHSAVSIETICDQCLYLAKGKQKLAGHPGEVMPVYEADMLNRAQNHNALRVSTSNGGEPAETDADLLNGVGKLSIGTPEDPELGHFISGEKGQITLAFQADNPSESLTDLSINAIIRSASTESHEFDQLISMSRDIGWIRATESKATMVLSLDPVILCPGAFTLKLSVSQGEMHDIIRIFDNMKLMVVANKNRAKASFYQPHGWHLDGFEISQAAGQNTEMDIEAGEDF